MAYPNNWTCPACGSIVNNSVNCTTCNYRPPAESGRLEETVKKSETLLKERIFAFIIDMVVLSVIVLVSVFIFLSFQSSEKPLITMLNLITPPALLIAFFIHPVYLLILEVMLKGKTYGKLIMKIRVVSSDESKPEISALLIRNLVRFIESLTLYIISIYYINKSAGQSQRLGDRIANTMIIKD